MSKVPVQKTVVRDGKVHTQTYWEGTDAQRGPARALAASRPTLAAAAPVEHDPVADAWGLVDPRPWTEACIAAGILPEAADDMLLPLRDTDLTEYIYSNGLDEMPRPRMGWGLTARPGDRRAWERVIEESGGKTTWEDAVAWSDAGFRYPWSGIERLIRDGVTPERAAEWRETFTARFEDGIAMFASEMLTEDLTPAEAIEWREALFSDRNRALGPKDLQYRALGFTQKAARAWKDVLMDETSILDAKALKDLKWSPTSIKKFLKASDRGGTRYNYLPQSMASDLRRATAEVGGPKVAIAWAPVAYLRYHDGYGDPEAVRTVVHAEQWLKHLREETGVELGEEDYLKVAEMLPGQREAFVELAKIMEFRPGATHSTYLHLAERIGSPENLRLLLDRGFEFRHDVPDVSWMDGNRLNQATATPAARDKWLRRMAADMYWKRSDGRGGWFTDKDRNVIIDDEGIDPVAFKDALLAHDGQISPVRLEGIAKAGVASAVSDGFL